LLLGLLFHAQVGFFLLFDVRSRRGLVLQGFCDLLLVLRLSGLGVYQLDLLLLDESVHRLLHLGVLQGIQDDGSHFISKPLFELLLDFEPNFLKDLVEGPLCDFRSHLERSFFPMNWLVSFFHLFVGYLLVVSLDFLVLCHFVLGDLLVENLLIELFRVFHSQVVVDLSSFGLHDVALGWVRAVG
jgi:hypothetical protein